MQFEFTNGLDNTHPYAFEVPRDEFDLVAVGRGLIANPDWVDRVKNQQELVPYRKECLAELA